MGDWVPDPRGEQEGPCTVRCLFFASLAKVAGGRELELEVPEGTTVSGLLALLEGRFPGLAAHRFQVAVNEEMADRQQVLPAGAEVALLPPVSGGMDDLVRLDREPISLDLLQSAVRRRDCGGLVFFLGTVRDSHQGDPVERIDYSAYEGMARKELVALVAEVRRLYPLGGVAVWHRLGPVEAGDASVGLAVSAPHRQEAFEGARWLIDRLKERVPIWKKEIGPDGEVWIEGDARVPS